MKSKNTIGFGIAGNFANYNARDLTDLLSISLKKTPFTGTSWKI